MADFIYGALFGALFSMAVAVVVTLLMSRPKLIPNEKDPVPKEQSRTISYAESIATQWQNMAVYDGTETGQKDIDR